MCDNDICLSCLVVVSDEKVIDVLYFNDFSEILVFYLIGFVKNLYLLNKIMFVVLLVKLDVIM